MKDMKKRIIALVLVVVMSVLSLASCSAGFDFAKEDLSKYADFNYAEFKNALAALEIEDGDFTANDEIRQAKVAKTVYEKIADAIVAATGEDEQKKSDVLGAGDVLYYVYYATDADGNVYFTADMKETAITASSTKADHVIKLGAIDVNDADENEIKKLIKENLIADADLAEYVYSMIEKNEIENNAKDELKELNPEATDEELKAAAAEAIKVKDGDKIVISYKRTFESTDAEGVTTTTTENAAYETVVVSADDAFTSKLIAEGTVANVDPSATVKVGESTSFKVTIGEVEYNYSDVKVLYRIDSEGKAISTFTYTFTEDKNVTPDNASATSKINLKNKELTYYVYPVYAIAAPAVEEIKASDVLEWAITGAKITADSFDAFEDEGYVYNDNGTTVTLPELVKQIVNIYDSEAEDNEFYAEGTELKKLFDEYLAAVEAGGDKPTDAQKDTINDAKEKYNDLQKSEAKKIYAKIDAAVKGEESASDAIVAEYSKDSFHTLKEAYDNEIIESVQAAVWALIEKSVKVNYYPEKMVKEYKKLIVDSYEYNYYKGALKSDGTHEAPFSEKYDTLNGYLISKDALNLSSEDKIDAAIEAQAKSYIEPIIKIFVVAKACEADAVAAMPGYIQQDIDAGAYEVDEHAYEETYGDAAAEKIEEAKANAEESKANAIEEATKFIIDKAYIRDYKKEIGNASYRQLVSDYGEYNLRASFQFNKLFYYLTSTNIEMNRDGDHMHTESKYVTVDGASYIDFRTVKYVIKAEAAAE